MSRLGPQGTTLAGGARLAERVIAGIGDQISITREARGSLNTTTMTYTPSSSDVYAGAGRVRRSNAGTDSAGGGEVVTDKTTVHIPLNTTGVQIGDKVTVTASRDVSLVGRVYVVTDLPASSASTSVALTVEQVRAAAVAATGVYVDTYDDTY